MKKILTVFLLIFVLSCSKKHIASKTETTTNTTNKKTQKKLGPWPKTLTIDDRAASKSIDGRLYIDLEGKRYWKNYNDGKYYLFDKSMYNNPAFKPH